MTRDQKIIQVIHEFDFERVHKAMVAVDWKWGLGGEYRSPTIEELKARAKKLLEDCPNNGALESGGFSVICLEHELVLRFVMASAVYGLE